VKLVEIYFSKEEIQGEKSLIKKLLWYWLTYTPFSEFL